MQARSFGGWRRDRIGVVFGQSMGALIVLAIGLMPAVIVFSQQRYVAAAVFLLVWLMVAVLISVPIRGRSAAVWVRHWLAWLVGRAAGVSMWVSRASEGEMRSDEVDNLDLPGALKKLELIDGPPLPALAMAQPCIVRDKRQGGAWRMVARLSHPGISMMDSQRLDGQAVALGDMLASLATSGMVRRLSIYARTEPGDMVQRQAWLARNWAGNVPPGLRQSVSSLEAQVRATSVSSELFVVIEVAEKRIRRDARAAGGGVTGRARVLYRCLGEVQQGLVAAGATGISWLTTSELVESIRVGFEPSARDEMAEARLMGGASVASVAPIAAAPARAFSDASVYRHGGYLTRSYTVVPPKSGTRVGSLGPLLAPASPFERRSLAIHYEPEPPVTAQRRVEREVTSAQMATDTRHRMGLRVRVRDRRQQDQVFAQEQVIAAGHSRTRMAVTCSLTVPAHLDISDHAAAMTAAARTRKFELYPLDLAQDLGFVASVLPVGIGMPSRKEL